MLLELSAIDKQTQLREFTCFPISFDLALNVLNNIASNGDTILKAYFIEDNSRIEIDPEAFDGQSLVKPLEQLKKQWESVLDNPDSSDSLTHWHTSYKTLTSQRVSLFERKIDHYNQLITKFEEFREQTKQFTYNSPRRERLLQRYEQMIQTYSRHISQAQSGLQIAQAKLAQLEKLKTAV